MNGDIKNRTAAQRRRRMFRVEGDNKDEKGVVRIEGERIVSERVKSAERKEMNKNGQP